jgi:hypothetical protein
MPIVVIVVIVVFVTTPPCLLKLVTTFLRLATVLTMTVNCFSEILLSLVDTLAAIVIGQQRARHGSSQQDCT